MKESFYFSHDYNARNDDKILEIRDKYKNDGYAVFFYCLETMAERGDGYLIPSLLGGLSLSYGVGKEWLLEFLEFCVKIGIFKKDDKGYYNSRMIDHINFRAKLSQAGTEGAKKRWGGYSTPNAKERKGKERKYNTADKSAETFNSNAYIEKMLLNKQKHIRIIGKYFKSRKNDFPSYFAIKAEIKRWLRSARELSEYTDEQIDKSYGYVSEKFKEEWNLSTVCKYIQRTN